MQFPTPVATVYVMSENVLRIYFVISLSCRRIIVENNIAYSSLRTQSKRIHERNRVAVCVSKAIKGYCIRQFAGNDISIDESLHLGRIITCSHVDRFKYNTSLYFLQYPTKTAAPEGAAEQAVLFLNNTIISKKLHKSIRSSPSRTGSRQGRTEIPLIFNVYQVELHSNARVFF